MERAEVVMNRVEGVMEQLAPPAFERRAETQRLIEVMLSDRQRMWVLYCRVAKLQPFGDNAGPVRHLLERFCQLLVDYIASSHFGLYARIGAGRERRRGVRELAAVVYPRIAGTTDLAMRFNDRCDASASFDLDDSFSAELSQLGQALAERFELEDQIIAQMLSRD